MTTPKSKFVYVTYIRTTPDELWKALTGPEFIKQYWFGMDVDCDFKAGSAWKLGWEDGRVADSGTILEAVPGKRLVIRWRNEWSPEHHAEGDALCVMDLEPEGDAVKLTITHSNDVENSGFIAAVSGGWPKIMSNLKSLIETGKVVMASKP